MFAHFVSQAPLIATQRPREIGAIAFEWLLRAAPLGFFLALAIALGAITVAQLPSMMDQYTVSD